MSKNLAIAALISGASLIGCATVAQPSEQWVQSEATVRAAERVGAAHVPEAAVHLQLAETQLHSAQGYAQSGYDEQAETLVGRAREDAELAIAITRKANTQAAAQRAADQLRALRQQQFGSPSGQ